jgi:hypothetical protein
MSDKTELQSETSATEGLSSTGGASLSDLLCWRPIDDEAKCGRKRLLSLLNEAGMRRTIVGFWVTKFSIEDNGDDYEDGDFNKENEMYYWHEGWYESIESSDEYSCCYAIKTVTHWMPLPKFSEAI